MHDIKLNGKTALITGASRGIGRAVALLFARAGASVAVNYHRDRPAAEDTANAVEALGVRSLILPADVGRMKEVAAMVTQVAEKLGEIDILVNNAGVWDENPIDSLSEERLQRAVQTNLLGCFYTAQATVPRMKAHGGGIIINVSSTAAQRGEARHSPYAATKSGVIGLTKSLAPELAAYNIRVNCVAPGWVQTDMSRSALQGDGREAVLQQIPLGRAATPEEIAGPILFLASDMATFITGEILNVNGGAVLCG